MQARKKKKLDRYLFTEYICAAYPLEFQAHLLGISFHESHESVPLNFGTHVVSTFNSFWLAVNKSCLRNIYIATYTYLYTREIMGVV